MSREPYQSQSRYLRCPGNFEYKTAMEMAIRKRRISSDCRLPKMQGGCTAQASEESAYCWQGHSPGRQCYEFCFCPEGMPWSLIGQINSTEGNITDVPSFWQYYERLSSHCQWPRQLPWWGQHHFRKAALQRAIRALLSERGKEGWVYEIVRNESHTRMSSAELPRYEVTFG